ncbi:SCP-like protein [Oesophagostomum dentatum]|uniref:SCP-like protein n=1 Tax=Oesophagostomum dentatum TaxID=61180 RepID=A0A0B1TFR2_OESDE|nr:SCP-like protein [Oesophagostomum dentatum]
MCSTTEVSDSIRVQFLDTHNVRRSALAKGQIKDAYPGRTALPTASNMLKLRWDCKLEKEAIDYINKCPTSTYAKVNDQQSGENFYRAAMSGFATPRDAVKKMGWATNQYLGCAIGMCSGNYIVVCRYNRMRPNTINYPQYNRGAPCSACPARTSCVSGMGLCN